MAVAVDADVAPAEVVDVAPVEVADVAVVVADAPAEDINNALN